MKLSTFIQAQRAQIVAEWEAFARALDHRGSMSSVALRDHADEILDAIAAYLVARGEQASAVGWSPGGSEGGARAMDAVGRIHAMMRIESGFHLADILAEYGALRACVMRLWGAEKAGSADVLTEVVAFNEAIDAAMAEAAERVAAAVSRYRETSIGILGHDLRSPLAAITVAGNLLQSRLRIDDANARLARRILSSADRMQRLVADVLDLTRIRLGPGLVVTPVATDLESVCKLVLSEMEAVASQPIVLEGSGDLSGEWDADRIAQLVANLVGNAVQHGAGTPVRVGLHPEGASWVVVEVHNEGPPIDPGSISSLFEPFVRGPAGAHDAGGGSLGLGLFIVREIAAAHGGSVSVASTAEEGTTFRVRLPRHPAPREATEYPQPRPADASRPTLQ